MSASSHKPLVVDLKRNSLDDGPGIRSVVFFKGCPLRCVWCQNPETFSPKAEIQCLPEGCLGCGACLDACSNACADPATWMRTRENCEVCGECVRACPAGARRVVGSVYEADELVEVLVLDEPFYRHSKGGVTFSGGEPTLYPDYVGQVAQALRSRGIHVLLETCGQFDWVNTSRSLLPNVDTIYYDLKLARAEQHRTHTGVGNKRILSNLTRLVAEFEGEILVRIPLIPEITSTPENLLEMARLLSDLNLKRVALMPYNPLWLGKRQALGLQSIYTRDTFMAAEEIECCRQIFVDADLEVV